MCPGGTWIKFPESAAANPIAHQRAYSAALAALATEMKVTVFNKAAERITGFTAEEAIGRNCVDVFCMLLRIGPWLIVQGSYAPLNEKFQDFSRTMLSQNSRSGNDSANTKTYCKKYANATQV